MIRTTFASLLASSVATVASAGALFPAGTESKVTGTESALASEGAPAALYNPANLGGAAAGTQPYAELGFVDVQYTYEHPDYDPVTVSVRSPTATLGFSRTLGSSVVLGAVLFPSKNGETEIPALPRKIGTSVVPIEAKAEDRILELGLAAAYRLAHGLTLGLGADVIYESHKIDASLVGSESELFSADYHNTFVRPIVGVNFAPVTVLEATLAAKPALKKTFEGEQRNAAVGEATDPRVTEYEPASVSVGASGTLGRAALGVEVRRLWWSEGRDSVKSLTYDDEPSADLSDVTEVSATASVLLPRRAALTAGYSYQPTAWGEGKDDGDLANHVYGVDYGRLDAMDRRTMGLGAKARVSNLDLSMALSRTQGERVVSDEGDNVGYYRLEVMSFSGAVKASF